MRLAEQEVPSSILGDFNVSFDFPLVRVDIGLNTVRKMEHSQREVVEGAPSASIDTNLVSEGTTFAFCNITLNNN